MNWRDFGIGFGVGLILIAIITTSSPLLPREAVRTVEKTIVTTIAGTPTIVQTEVKKETVVQTQTVVQTLTKSLTSKQIPHICFQRFKTVKEAS
ncbi:MAG: hypothetical protein QXX95_08055 [Nitrososphaerales archaeon]